MNFKYSAFTENTPEMREWLESIGYKLNIFNSMEALHYIFAEDGVFHLIDKSTLNHVINMEYVINCLSNPALFKAVTAVREDSDKGKHFIDSDGRFVECQRETIREFIDRAYIAGYDISDLREATLSELQEHFKIR